MVRGKSIERPFSKVHRQIVVDTIREMERMIGRVCEMRDKCSTCKGSGTVIGLTICGGDAVCPECKGRGKVKRGKLPKGVLDERQKEAFHDGVNGVLQKGAERLEQLYRKGVKDPDKYDWEARSIMWRGMLALAWSSWVSEAKSRDGRRPAKSRASWANNHDRLLRWVTQYLAIGESQVWSIMNERENEILARPDIRDYVSMSECPTVCDWCGEECREYHLDSSGNTFHRIMTAWYLCDKCWKKRKNGKCPPKE